MGEHSAEDFWDNSPFWGAFAQKAQTEGSLVQIRPAAIFSYRIGGIT